MVWLNICVIDKKIFLNLSIFEVSSLMGLIVLGPERS